VAPRAYKELKTQQKSLALENPIAMFLPKKVMDGLGGYVIYCDEKENDVLRHFQAFNLVGEGDVPALGPIILAEKATLKADLENKAINAEFENMLTLTHQFEDYDESGKKLTPEQVVAVKAAGGTFRTVLSVSAPVRSRNSPQALDLSKAYNKATRPRVSGLTMDELKEVYSSTSRGATGEGVTDPNIREYITTLNSNQRKILSSECLTTYNSRYSFSLACITLTLVGISFGITAQRRDTSSGFILSLVVVIFYFGFIMLGELLKGTPKMKPELWVWLPNVLFGGLGIFMFWKHQRR
jgi:lipopolysaccharide export system permease protein